MSRPTPAEASHAPDSLPAPGAPDQPPMDVRGSRAWRPLRALRQMTLPPTSCSPFTLLRRRLVITTTTIVAVVLAALCVVFYAYEARATLTQVDRQLATEATTEAAKGLPHLTEAPDEDESPYQPGSPNLFSIVVAPSHRVLQDDDQVQRVGLPEWTSAETVLQGTQASQFVTVVHGGVSYRLYTVPVREDGHIVAAVQSGTALSVYRDQLQTLLRVLVLLSLCALLLTTLLSIWLAERALAPARAAFARQRQFAAAASHELRTPLAFIRSQAELIAGATAARIAPTEITAEVTAEVTADAREILTEVDYLTRMTRDLLLLARDEHDTRALARTSVDLHAIVREAAATAQPLARERGVDLVAVGGSARAGGSERAGNGPFVWGDTDRLRQLALILLDNAIHYTPRGGRVAVDVRAERKRRLSVHHEGVALLTVRDSGVGIAPSELPRIFEPFYRANAPRPHVRDEHGNEDSDEQGDGITDGGTGLGLALAQWITHAHGGEMSVHSTPGVGSTFTVSLPLLAHRAQSR